MTYNVKKKIRSVALISAVAGGLALSVASPASAATSASCGVGSGGADADKICWFDFSGYDDTLARSAAGQDVTVTAPNGDTISFNLTTVPSAGAPIAAPASTPTFSGANVGTASYVGIPGSPALRARSNMVVPSSITFSLKNITVTKPSGQAAPGFTLVTVDAEATGQGERMTWQSDKSISLRASLLPPAGPGPENGCGKNLSGIGSTTVSCFGNTNSGNDRWDSVLLQADSPTTMTAKLEQVSANGASAVAFGYIPVAVVDAPVVDPLIAGGAALTAAGVAGAVYGVRRKSLRHL